MESFETPGPLPNTQPEQKILLVKCDDIEGIPTKVQPIKIVIPTASCLAKIPTTGLTPPPKMIISPVHLSTQPTVSVKVGTNQMNIKMVTNASLIQNSLTSPVVLPVVNGVTEKDEIVERDDSPATKMTREQKELQAAIRGSHVLSQMIADGETTVRKSRGRKKKQSPKLQQQQRMTRSKSRETVKTAEDSFAEESHGSSSPLTEQMIDSDQGSTPKRHNMRSANAEFALKQKSFMKEIIKTQDSDDAEGSDDENGIETKSNCSKGTDNSLPQAPKKGWSRYCWRCYQCGSAGGELLSCCSPKCKRAFHSRCLSKQQQPLSPTEKFICVECTEIDAAETVAGGKPKFEMDFVSTLLTFVCNRMLQTKNSNLLTSTTEDESAPNYEDIVVHPMNLDILQNNIKSKKYKSIEAFHSDAKWLLYNCAVLPQKRRFLPNAKSLLKVCRQEILEIETCFECYFKANTDAEWFTDVCSSPHILLWAKLRGFPYWPAKSMSVNATTGQVNVRFFGAHDRAWINVKDCYLYSKEDPNGTNPKKQNDIAECIKEVNTHIERLADTFNGFKHAALRTPYDPTREPEQLKQLLPNIDRYHRPTDTCKLVEALISGHKPKLTLKIIRTADNTLATTSTITAETNGEKVAGKFTMKRSADSWTIQSESKTKKQKIPEESEVDKQKGALMRSLNLEQRKSVVKEGTPSSGSEKGSVSGRKSVNGKRRKTIHHAENNPTRTTPENENPKEEEEEVQKRRSTRHKSTNPTEIVSSKENETPQVQSTPVPAKIPPTKAPAGPMTEPPPLVPFESVQIKPDPDAEEAPRTPAVPKPTENRQERIKVKSLNTLTNNPPPSRPPQDISTKNLATQLPPSVSITQINGPKRTPPNRPSKPVPPQNMVVIPAAERNGLHNQSTSSSSASNDEEPPIHALSGFITPNFAAAITDAIVGSGSNGPPKLTVTPKRTRSALRGELDNSFNSEAGPVSRLLNDNSHRIADFFRQVMLDTVTDMAANGSAEMKVRMLETEIEQLKQKHAKEMAEVKHNSDLILSEFKKSQEKREAQLVDEISRKCELERIRAVEKAIEETKSKNWCNFCKREAIYHCCSSTWYCGKRCQQQDWGEHLRYCHNGNKQECQTMEQVRERPPPQHIQQPNIPLNVPLPGGMANQAPRGAHAVFRQKRPNVIRPQQMLNNLVHPGLMQQRASKGPQIVSVRGMVK